MSFFTTPRDSSIIEDRLGNQTRVGIFGALKVAEPTKQIGETFTGPNDTEYALTETLTGTGTIETQFNHSLLKMSTGGNGSVKVTTKHHLRYQAGSAIETEFTAQFEGTPTGSDLMLIGLYEEDDGVYVGYKGSDFVVGYRNIYADGGVGNEPDVTQIVDMSAYDMTKLRIFRISLGYLGVANITYEIMDGGEWKTLHTFVTDNIFDKRAHVGNPILPMQAEVSSTSNTLTLYSGSWNAATFDKESNIQTKPFFHRGSRTVTPTAAGAPIVAFRSKIVDGSYPSHIDSKLLFSEFGTGSEGLYFINFYKYPAGTLVSGTWNDINSLSVLEVNETCTEIPAASDDPIFAKTLAIPSSGTGVGTVALDFDSLGIIAHPGDEFLITKQEIIAGAGNDLTTWSIAYLDLR